LLDGSDRARAVRTTRGISVGDDADMTVRTVPRVAPRAILTARRSALVQASAALALVVVGAGYALFAEVQDHRDARNGTVNGFAGLGEALGLILAAYALAAAVLVGVPALLLRGRTARIGWTSLVVVEAAFGLVVLRHVGLLTEGSAAALTWLACAAAVACVLVPLLLPAARRWVWAGRGS
jgi:hypothetical protein